MQMHQVEVKIREKSQDHEKLVTVTPMSNHAEMNMFNISYK